MANSSTPQRPSRNGEQRAARAGVALFDQTSFSKYLVTGRDAEQVLQWPASTR